MKEILFEIFINLVRVIIAAACSIGAYYVKTVFVPWLKDRHLYEVVGQYVRAAEKLAGSGKIGKEQKNEYVKNLLTASHITITPAVNAMIEAVCEELDEAKWDWVSEFPAVEDDTEG